MKKGDKNQELYQ